MRPVEVVVVGSYNRDLSLFVRSLPAPGETVIGEGRLEAPGGKGSNQALQAARCGAATAMIAAVGVDAPGDEALTLWRAAGVEATGVARLSDAPTGMAAILVDAHAENVIVVDSGANARLSPETVDAARGLFGSARVVVAQLETPASATVRAFELGRASGALTVLNAAPAPESVDARLLALTDILIVNRGEGAAMTGHDTPAAIGESLLGQVARAVVITVGKDGAELYEHAHPPVRRPALPVSAVDTTGAGDAFTGAFAAKLAASGELRAALDFGLAAGAFACQARGASASYGTAADLERLVGTVSGPA